MLMCPHEMLQNHLIGIEGVRVHSKSCQDGGGPLRVAASSNPSIEGDVQGIAPSAAPHVKR
jgi:hypothetical protein